MAEEKKELTPDAFIAAHEGEVNKRWYPRFHIAPRVGWCNDPNGFAYFNGQYHLFYQHYPYEPKWGPMHWGHVTSSDLVHWQRQPVALFPDYPYDADGCFSGCGIEKDGRLCLLYTGHVDLLKKPGQPDRIETQNLAVSTDGVHFTKDEHNPVITFPEDVPTGEDHHFRDPKVWQHDGLYYAVVGAQTPEETGQVLVFTSEDLEHWQFKHVMAKAEGNQGFMWECPNFAEFDGHEALILSPQGVKPEGRRYLNLHQSVSMLGKMDYKAGIFYHDDFELLDYGFDFYAPQVMQAPDGRCLMIGWLAMWESAMPEQADGWSCQMTVPRELHYRHDKLVTPPAKELTALREKAFSQPETVLTEETSFAEWSQETGELIAEFDLSEAKGLAIHFAAGFDDEVAIRLEKESGNVTLSRKSPSTGRREERFAKLPAGQTKLAVRVYEDRSSLEIFLNDGEVVMSTRFYPKTEERVIVLEPQEGTVRMTEGVFYELGDIFA